MKLNLCYTKISTPPIFKLRSLAQYQKLAINPLRYQCFTTISKERIFHTLEVYIMCTIFFHFDIQTYPGREIFSGVKVLPSHRHSLIVALVCLQSIGRYQKTSLFYKPLTQQGNIFWSQSTPPSQTQSGSCHSLPAEHRPLPEIFLSYKPLPIYPGKEIFSGFKVLPRHRHSLIVAIVCLQSIGRYQKTFLFQTTTNLPRQGSILWGQSTTLSQTQSGSAVVCLQKIGRYQKTFLFQTTTNLPRQGSILWVQSTTPSQTQSGSCHSMPAEHRLLPGNISLPNHHQLTQARKVFSGFKVLPRHRHSLGVAIVCLQSIGCYQKTFLFQTTTNLPTLAGKYSLGSKYYPVTDTVWELP